MIYYTNMNTNENQNWEAPVLIIEDIDNTESLVDFILGVS
jgi:tRNA uridine 5-carbamoylmethylation protein Kti12